MELILVIMLMIFKLNSIIILNVKTIETLKTIKGCILATNEQRNLNHQFHILKKLKLQIFWKISIIKFKKVKEMKSGGFEYMRHRLKKNMSESKMEYTRLKVSKRRKNSKTSRNSGNYLSKGKLKKRRRNSKGIKK